MSQIEARPCTAEDITAAIAWWRSPWSLPRGEAPEVVPADYPLAFTLNGSVLGIGGLVDAHSLPPGTRRLSIAVAASVSNRWQLYTIVRQMVLYAFAQDGVWMVVGQCKRDEPELYALWRWLVDRVTRDLPAHVAAGGWHHDPNGAELSTEHKADPDKCPVLYWDWVKQG